MARRIIIGEILNLIKGLGGNPQKFMGTKTNINFLGKGPKEALFQGQIDIDGLMRSGFPIERVIGEAETAGGYAVANKLNDLQLQRLKDNLIQLKKVYQPEQIPNVTDMATRTGALTQEGLGSLRTTQLFEEQRPLFDQAGKLAAAESAAMRKAGLDPSKQADFFKWEEIKKGKGIGSFSEELAGAEETVLPASSLMTRISDRMKKIKEMSDELGEMGKGVNLSKYDDAALNALAEEGNRIKVQLDKSGISYEQFQKLSARKKEIDDILRAAQDVPPSGYNNFKADLAMEKQKAGTYTMVDPTAEKSSYASKFNPKNEVHVNKAKALLEDPQIKGVYTEAEVKNAYNFEGLYQSHFDKGQVDIARFFEQAGHNIPQMRASARDALLQLMKKEDRAGSGLKSFIDEVDLKYITEGGGGRAGDPINLMAKYFGKNATESLPKTATKENIDKFTDFIMNARDSRGRGINDPFFDRETIDFRTFEGFADELPPFASGGRVDADGLGEILQVPRTSFRWGSGLSKALLRRINKKMIKDAVDDIFPTGDYKMDAEIAAEALVENNPKLFGNKLIDDLDDAARSDIYGLVLGEVSARFGLNLKKQRGIKSLIKGVDEQFGEGTLKRASDVTPSAKYDDLRAVKDFEGRNRTFTPNREMIRAKYQGLIDDNLLNQILADNNPQRIAEVLATIDQALLMQGKGMGSQDIMAALRGSWKRKPSASGGLAKILEV